MNGLGSPSRKSSSGAVNVRTIEHADVTLKSDGRLVCALCQVAFDTEKQWTKHARSNQHSDVWKPLDVDIQQQVFDKILLFALIKRQLSLPRDFPLDKFVSLLPQKNQMRCLTCKQRIPFNTRQDCVMHYFEGDTINNCGLVLSRVSVSSRRDHSSCTPSHSHTPPPILTQINNNSRRSTTTTSVDQLVQKRRSSKRLSDVNGMTDGVTNHVGNTAKRARFQQNGSASALNSACTSRANSVSCGDESASDSYDAPRHPGTAVTTSHPNNIQLACDSAEAGFIMEKFQRAFTSYTFLSHCWKRVTSVSLSTHSSLRPFLERNLAYRNVLRPTKRTPKRTRKAVRLQGLTQPCTHIDHKKHNRLCLHYLFPARSNANSSSSTPVEGNERISSDRGESSTGNSDDDIKTLRSAETSPEDVKDVTSADSCRVVLRCVRDPLSRCPTQSVKMHVRAVVFTGSKVLREVDLGTHDVEVNSEKAMVYVQLDENVYEYVEPKSRKGVDATSAYVIIDTTLMLPADEYSPTKGCTSNGRSLRRVPNRLSLESSSSSRKPVRASRHGDASCSQIPLVSHRFVGAGELWSSKAGNEFGAVTCSRTITFMPERDIPSRTSLGSADFVQKYLEITKSRDRHTDQGLFVFLKYDIERTMADESDGELEAEERPVTTIRSVKVPADVVRRQSYKSMYAKIYKSSPPIAVPPQVFYSFVWFDADSAGTQPTAKSLLAMKRLKNGDYGGSGGAGSKPKLKYVTEHRPANQCPLCMLKFTDLWMMVKHQRYEHPRLAFKVQSLTATTCVIEIQLNKNSDERDEVHPHAHHQGVDRDTSRTSKIRTGRWMNRRCKLRPEKRNNWSQLIIDDKWTANQLRVRMCHHDASDLFKMEPTHGAFYTAGHSRQYFHSRTLQPCLLEKFQSGADSDCLWMRQAATCNIHEFTDLNLGEVSMMELWNQFRRTNPITHDDGVYAVALRFVADLGDEIHKRHLYNNCVLHFAKLRDHQLINYKQMHQLLSLLKCAGPRLDAQPDEGATSPTVSVTGLDEEPSAPVTSSVITTEPAKSEVSLPAPICLDNVSTSTDEELELKMIV